MEYGYLAKYYDLFYTNKRYEKEIDFLISLLGNRRTVLDAGCGTGEHIRLLEIKGYTVDGFDLNNDMLEIARTKTQKNLSLGNILTFNNGKKYDIIISMFAVFNHLRDYKEFEIAIKNLLKSLNKKGILIIDLHNARKSGEKTDIINNLTRQMKWQFNPDNMIETTKIKYVIENSEFNDQHIF